MYTPTQAELEELGFKAKGDYMVYGGSIAYYSKLNIMSTIPIYLYPKNIEDVKTIIRMMYPQ